MAITISQFSSGVVVLGFNPPMNKSSDVVRDSREIQTYIAKSLDNPDANLWCIYDFSEVKLEFSQLTMLFIDQARRKPGSFLDPRVRIVAVIPNPTLMDELASFLNHYGIEMPIFPCFGEAADHVYRQVDVEMFYGERG